MLALFYSYSVLHSSFSLTSWTKRIICLLDRHYREEFPRPIVVHDCRAFQGNVPLHAIYSKLCLTAPKRPHLSPCFLPFPLSLLPSSTPHPTIFPASQCPPFLSCVLFLSHRYHLSHCPSHLVASFPIFPSVSSFPYPFVSSLNFLLFEVR